MSECSVEWNQCEWKVINDDEEVAKDGEREKKNQNDMFISHVVN